MHFGHPSTTEWRRRRFRFYSLVHSLKSVFAFEAAADEGKPVSRSVRRLDASTEIERRLTLLDILIQGSDRVTYVNPSLKRCATVQVAPTTTAQQVSNDSSPRVQSIELSSTTHFLTDSALRSS